MRRWITLGTAAVLTAGLTISGCSSNSDTASTSGTVAGASSATSPPKTTATPETNASTPDSAVSEGRSYCEAAKAVKDFSGSSEATANPTQAQLDAYVALLTAAHDGAPADLQAQWGTILDIYKKVATLGPDKVKSEEATALFLSDDARAASVKIDSGTKDACGFTLTGDPTSSGSDGSGSGSGSGSPGTTTGTATATATDTSNLPAACKDVTSSFDTDKTDPASIYNVKLHVCLANPDASWMTSFLGSSFSASGSTTWDVAAGGNVTGTSFTADEALHACDAMATYFATVSIDADITVGIVKADSAKPDPVLAARRTGGVCAAP